MSPTPAPPVRTAAALVLALAVAACDSSSPAETNTTIPNFEGTYSLLGTYTGRPGNSVEGSLVVSGQASAGATAAISVRVTDNGNLSFALNTTDPDPQATSGPGTATLAADGSFSITYAGSEVISGLPGCCNFTFAMQGKLTGNVISGTWTLTRDMPSLDSGTFQATR